MQPDVHSRAGYDFPAEYQWTLQGPFEMNHSTLLLTDSRPTYSLFCPYHIRLLLLFMNGFCIIHASIFPSYHSGSADDTDAKLNRRGSGM